MQIPILLERVANNGYRVSCRAPFELAAEGATADEALARLSEQLRGRMAAGATIVSLEVPTSPNPLMAGVEILDANPLFDEWQAEIANYTSRGQE